MAAVSNSRNELAEQTADAVARHSYGKLVAILARRTGDIAAAEDALAEAFATALVDWPRNGTPKSPEAWLIAVARRRHTDAERRRRLGESAIPHLERMIDELHASTSDKGQIPDQRLVLMFTCAHPAIDADIRAPLILQTVLGFDAASIASGFLLAPSTMSQRLVRAKTKIKQAGIPFHIPEPEEMGERLEAVIDAIYAAFTAGWSDPIGVEPQRRELAGEAIWLSRLLSGMLPNEPEALGLTALLLYAEARNGARRGPTGNYIPLADQDTDLWDEALIAEAEQTLSKASQFSLIGRYQLMAALQSAHVGRRLTGLTDWPAIVQLYDGLLALTGSPVVAINRAIAIAETNGADDALAALGEVANDVRLVEYQPYWAARADLLSRAGQVEAADHAYQLAIGLEADPAVRRFLQGKREPKADAE